MSWAGWGTPEHFPLKPRAGQQLFILPLRNRQPQLMTHRTSWPGPRPFCLNSSPLLPDSPSRCVYTQVSFCSSAWGS